MSEQVAGAWRHALVPEGPGVARVRPEEQWEQLVGGGMVVLRSVPEAEADPLFTTHPPAHRRFAAGELPVLAFGWLSREGEQPMHAFFERLGGRARCGFRSVDAEVTCVGLPGHEHRHLAQSFESERELGPVLAVQVSTGEPQVGRWVDVG